MFIKYFISLHPLKQVIVSPSGINSQIQARGQYLTTHDSKTKKSKIFSFYPGVNRFKALRLDPLVALPSLQKRENYGSDAWKELVHWKDGKSTLLQFKTAV